MKILLTFIYNISRNPELVEPLAARFPNANIYRTKGKIYEFNYEVIHNSPEHLQLKEFLAFLGVSQEPYEMRKGPFEKIDVERAKYFQGYARKEIPDETHCCRLGGIFILSRPLPKFRYAIHTIVDDQVREALEKEGFTGLRFLPVHLSKKPFVHRADLVDPVTELIPGVHELYSSVLLPYASVPNPLYKDLNPRIRTNLYSLKDLEGMGFSDACLAPPHYFLPPEHREERNEDDYHWVLYSKRFCNFLDMKFRGFEWTPQILAEDAL